MEDPVEVRASMLLPHEVMHAVYLAGKHQATGEPLQISIADSILTYIQYIFIINV